MFSKLAFFSVAFMTVFVAAAPSLGGFLPVPGGSTAPAPGYQSAATASKTPNAGYCNTGPVQCCDTVYDSHSKEADVLDLLAVFGAALGPVGTLIGQSCSPITALGMGAGSSCSSTTVCCTNNEFRGLVALGCTPVNINL